jgi:hypothetical protein
MCAAFSPGPRAGPRGVSRAAETASALIELALSESQAPVAALGAALARIAHAAAAGGPPPDEDVTACIESLQFHDRLTQQLTQVRDLLASLAVSSEAPAAATPRTCADAQVWPVLLENLRARFTSESHRILFNLLMSDEHGRSRATALHASEGSVELF